MVEGAHSAQASSAVESGPKSPMLIGSPLGKAGAFVLCGWLSAIGTALVMDRRPLPTALGGCCVLATIGLLVLLTLPSRSTVVAASLRTCAETWGPWQGAGLYASVGSVALAAIAMPVAVFLEMLPPWWGLFFETIVTQVVGLVVGIFMLGVVNVISLGCAWFPVPMFMLLVSRRATSGLEGVGHPEYWVHGFPATVVVGAMVLLALVALCYSFHSRRLLLRETADNEDELEARAKDIYDELQSLRQRWQRGNQLERAVIEVRLHQFGLLHSGQVVASWNAWLPKI